MRILSPTKRREAGFTLLELLLVIGVSGLLLLGISKLTRSWIDAEIATASGQHLERTASVVKRYIEANWTTLTNTDDALVAAAGGGVWGTLDDDLSEEGLLTGTNLRNPIGINLKIAYITDTSVTPAIYRATIYSDGDLPSQRALLAARQAGNVGGTISNFPDGNFAIGSFAQWAVAKNQLLPGGVDPCPASDTPSGRGCLIGLVSYSETTIVGPYLYRSLILGDPQFNTMNTPLLMNSNNIVGASNIQTQSLDVLNDSSLGSMNVAGAATFNGPTTISNGMTVANGMTVTGDADFADNVNMNGGTLNATTLNAATVQAPTIRTNNLDTQNLAINNGSLTVDDAVNVNGDLNVTAPGSEIFVNTVNAGTIDANNGTLTVGQINIENSMNISGTVHITDPTKTLIVDRLIADDCVKINDGTGTGTYLAYGNPACP
jgi:prepilin-type N-terminal cleavage/methylation domain-containing protein